MHSFFAALLPDTGKEGPVKIVRLVARDIGEYMGAIIYLSNKRMLRPIDCLQLHEVDLERLRANAFRHEVLPVFSQIFDRPPLSYLMKEEPVLCTHTVSRKLHKGCLRPARNTPHAGLSPLRTIYSL